MRIGTSPVLQHHFTGVRTVSPTAGLDRVISLGKNDITLTFFWSVGVDNNSIGTRAVT